jgi:hypothetical protein
MQPADIADKRLSGARAYRTICSAARTITVPPGERPRLP